MIHLQVLRERRFLFAHKEPLFCTAYSLSKNGKHKVAALYGDNMKEKFGVYALIFHTDHGEMIYIGSTTVSFRARLNDHNHYLRYNKHHSSHVQRLWNKYGSFEFRVLEECTDRNIVAGREQFYIEQTNPEQLVNFGPALPAPFLGRKHSEETRKKISDSSKGKSRPWSSAIAKALSEKNKGRVGWLRGKHWTQEIREKISKSGRGKKHNKKSATLSDEHRKNISQALKGRAPWNKGKTGFIKSAETITKLSMALKGKTKTPEHRKHLSESKLRKNSEGE